MSTPILILGASGSGKSTSMRTLDSKKTFMINVCRKELPFKSSRSMYTEINNESNKNGNMLSTDDYDSIKKAVKYVDQKRPEITTMVIDDSQYLIVNEFMKKHSTQGKGNDVFNLYNNIADNFWNLLWDSKMMRQNLFIVFLHHCETTEFGIIKAKTIGKMLDEKIDIPGMFTIVLYAKREGNKNYFFTQNDGTSPAKTPDGMFLEDKISNDLQLVINSINQYYKGDEK
jgi:hypothetical protein